MDSSPRPQRRFSRWQTTKRTFVLGDIAYKPQSATNEILQEKHGKSEVAKAKEKKIQDKNEKVHKRNILDLSATKQTPQSLSSVTKPAVVRQLYMNSSRETRGKNVAAITAISRDDNVALGKTSKIIMTISRNKTGRLVTTDPELSQGLLSQHENGECGNEDISNESAHQKNNYALSNISQNPSADKPVTFQTCTSQTKTYVSRSFAEQNANEARGETSRRKRRPVDDAETSDTSTTNKENKDKDTTNSDVPSHNKKVKQDETLTSMSTSIASQATVGDLNISQRNRTIDHESEVPSDRRTALRNRKLLASPGTFLNNRQYPLSNSVGKKNSPGKDSSKKKGKSVTGESSFNKKVTSKRQSPISEKKSKQRNTRKMSSQKSAVNTNHSHNNSKHVEVSSLELNKSIGLLRKSKTHNVAETKSTSTVSSFSTTSADKQVHSEHSHESSSSSVRSGLRDRTLLTTPHDMQQGRQYPISFFYSQKPQSSGATIARSNLKTILPLKPAESASSKSLSNSRSETSELSISETNPRKNSSTSKNFSTKSNVSQNKISLKSKSESLLQNDHLTKIDAKIVSSGNMGKRTHATYPDRKEKKQSSNNRHLTTNHDSDLNDSIPTVQLMPNLSRSSKDIRDVASNSYNSQKYKQKSPQVRSIQNPTEKSPPEGKRKPAKTSILSKKSSPSKDKRLYSLPRRPVKRSSNNERNFITHGGTSTAFETEDLSFQPSQLSTVIVDTNERQPKNIGLMKHIAPVKSSIAINRKKAAGQTHLPVSNSKAECQEVLLWNQDGRTRGVSSVTAFDVILQAVTDAEDKLIDDIDSDSAEENLVKKVMSKFKNRIKTKIIKQREVETLKHDIRQKNRRINELMDTIKEKLKENAQLHRKKQKRFDTDQELQLIRYSEIMKGYRELMQAVATTS